MNCANHPAEAAVAQCTECGKGLCVQCVQNQPKPVCAACHEKLRSQTVGSIVFHLLVYVGLFIPMEGKPQMAQGALPKASLKEAIDKVMLGK